MLKMPTLSGSGSISVYQAQRIYILLAGEDVYYGWWCWFLPNSFSVGSQSSLSSQLAPNRGTHVQFCCVFRLGHTWLWCFPDICGFWFQQPVEWWLCKLLWAELSYECAHFLLWGIKSRTNWYIKMDHYLRCGYISDRGSLVLVTNSMNAGNASLRWAGMGNSPEQYLSNSFSWMCESEPSYPNLTNEVVDSPTNCIKYPCFKNCLGKQYRPEWSWKLVRILHTLVSSSIERDSFVGYSV